MTSETSASEPLVATVVPLVPAWRVDRTFDYAVPEKLSRRVTVGSLVRVGFGGRRVRAIVTSLTAAPRVRVLEEVIAVVTEEPVAPPPLADVLEWIALRYVAPRGTAYARAVPVRVKSGSQAGTPGSRAASAARLPEYDGGGDLRAGLAEGRAGTWVVRTIPSEDRGALIAEMVSCLPAGRSALIAVPEVRYGSAVIDELESRVGPVARLDSARPDAERAAAWFEFARGASVAAGGRGCLLAPTPALGLIVVDEEHHDTYKEDRAPRFDARRVAEHRAREEGAACVFVSASPSLVSSMRAVTAGGREISPTSAMRRASRPLVRTAPVPEDASVGPELHAAIRTTLRDGGRVGLLVPAGGYSRAIWCAACRRSVRCPRCEAGLFFHRGSGTDAPYLRCATCGYGAPPPDACPSCRAADWRYMGAGSERLEEQIAKAFPRSSVARVDPSVLDEPGGPREVDANIYVTTWIGTKVQLRPDVSLVGVLNADALIRRPDYRAAERACQALFEMADWAGPAVDGGQLLIQVSEPGHHAVQAVVRNDYPYFVERELPLREELFYPPFSELVKLRAGGPDGRSAMDAAAAVARAAGARVLGPVARRDGSKRGGELEMLLKCANAEELSGGLRELLSSDGPGRALHVDVDPR